ncbi:hypothetical protein COCHEDRAFT_1213211 [Bipolaris maydis C5]|uniref:Uncharacterized protein n=2 Tax=Cochliobolus heterostrophus (strain C5 / ATCC 48332 / race O) TaxID=701091 RepID=M2UWB9_COCH5|nr:hypothetical protein COCHEDRAFT_1216836 [Bipolaris maydis C5]EMD92133.1 hypothetical protein COCHEDRAFT_1213211 [Bipolaris maydis C5]KAJ6194645.1 hypothetical protein J3E72DRAFT_377109 [Bipolaris maydis]KAJ6201202.1 hypothetical protein J3E72DRAFT_383645 [Bipolaris maydis]
MSGVPASSHTRGGSIDPRRSSQRSSLGSQQAANITQDTVMTEGSDGNLVIQKEVNANFVKRIVNCRSVAQLVSFVPAIAQDRTKLALDDIVNAHIKKAYAVSLLTEWRDLLAKESLDSIPELKSIRAPSIQVSKLAEKEGSIDKDFKDSLKEARKFALTRMIDIKNREVEALSALCGAERNANKLHDSWTGIANTSEGVSAEAISLLHSPDCAQSLVFSAISIGENTADKQIREKSKKSETVKKTQTNATATMPKDSKALEEFVKEIAKRQKQSAMDRSKARKSGKGRRGAGPSKTKNQKNPNKIGKKDRKPRNGKRGTSSKRQQKKR